MIGTRSFPAHYEFVSIAPDSDFFRPCKRYMLYKCHACTVEQNTPKLSIAHDLMAVSTMKMRLLTLAQAAELLGLKVATLRFWTWQRKIEIVRVGRAVRVREDTIRKLIEQGTVPARRS
jgi:excisionase family DNA binding protein